MMKKFGIPSCIYDYGSSWNPLILAFITNERNTADKSHVSLALTSIDSRINNFRSMIDISKLEEYGAKRFNLRKDEILFTEGSEALFYFQLLSGSVKMVTTSRDGQEFMQGVFNSGDSFGEPPLFCDFPYPSTAIAIENAELIRLPKQNFLNLLKYNFDIHLMFDRVLCNRLKYKSMVLADISFHDPEQRISNLLKYIKVNSQESMKNSNDHSFVVPFTRQQLADMSGLRVETVIRTVKKLEKKGKLEIVDRKISI